MFVPELKVNLLSISTLEDKGYVVMLLIRSKGVTLNEAVRLGIRDGMMYRLLG